MFGFSKTPFYNKKLSDYCKQSTIESITRFTKIYNKRKTFYPILDKTNYQLLDSYTPNPPPKNINIFIFLSISTMLFYFFSTTKINKFKK